MRKETEGETQFTTKIGGSSGALIGKGGGLEPITNYRIKHVDTHFFIVVKMVGCCLHLTEPTNMRRLNPGHAY